MGRTRNAVICGMRLSPFQVQEGRWDYDGEFAPVLREDGTYGPVRGSVQTFSLGCFRYIARKDGSGLKRARVAWRVSGRVEYPEEVYAKAEAFCARKEAQGAP